MSERGRGNVRNTNSQNHNEGGWTMVERKKRVNWSERRGYNLHRKAEDDERWRRRMGTSMCVDDIPPFYDAFLLRRLFGGLGKINDTYVPWKRRIETDTRYGFVCFEKEEEAVMAMKKLQGVLIYGHKIIVKNSYVIKNKKEEVSRAPIQGNQNEGRYVNITDAKRSHAEVLAPKSSVWVKKLNPSPSKIQSEKSRLNTDEEQEERTMIITTEEWKKLTLHQQNLEEKIKKLESCFRVLQEEMRKWLEKKNEENIEKEVELDSGYENSEEGKEERKGDNNFDDIESKVSDTYEEGELREEENIVGERCTGFTN